MKKERVEISWLFKRLAVFPLRIRDHSGTLYGGGCHLSILCEHTSYAAGLRRLPPFTAFCDDFIADLEFDGSVEDTVFNDIAVLNECDESADCGFGGNMTDNAADAAAGEAAVRNERYAGAQTESAHDICHEHTGDYFVTACDADKTIKHNYARAGKFLARAAMSSVLDTATLYLQRVMQLVAGGFLYASITASDHGKFI